MPFHNPISNYERGQQPDPRSGSGSGSGSGRKQSGGMKSLVQAMHEHSDEHGIAWKFIYFAFLQKFLYVI